MLKQTRQTARAAVFLLGALAALSCGREVTSPDAGRHLARGVSFVTEFGGGGATSALIGELVPFTQVRIVLRNLAGDVVVNRLIAFPSDVNEVPVSLTVPLATANPEVMTLALAYVNAAGDTVFRAGPDSVLLEPSRRGAPPPPPIELDATYTGPGAVATTLAIAPEADTVVSGDAFAFTATAFDAQMNPVASAPIGWRSLTPALATITALGAGDGVTLAGRGTALIEAFLANGATDTVSLVVLPKASVLELASGNNQTGNAGALLSAPVSVRVRATDNLPMAGVAVTFVPGNGGSVGQAAVLTDANGLATTTWTLGTVAGAQSLSASVNGLTGSPVTFAATANAVVVGPVLLHHLPFTAGTVDIVGAAPSALQGGAVVSGGMLRLNGGSDALEFSAPLVPTTGSWSMMFFVRNRSLMTQRVAYLGQGTAGAPALVIGHDATGNFTLIDTAATAAAAPTNDNLFHHIAIVADSAANVITVYRNGAPWITGLAYQQIALAGAATRLGQGVPGLSASFVGDLDELRIYRGVISTETITTFWEIGPELAPPSRIVFTTVAPTTLPSGAAFPEMCAEVQDFVGRRRTVYGAPLTVDLVNNASGAILSGTLTVPASAGVACFADLSISGAGSGISLRVSGANATAAISGSFDVVAGPASQLMSVSFTGSGVAGEPFVPPQAVAARDAALNLAVDFTGEVTVSIVSGPPGGVLVGTTTVAAVAGIATFSDLTMNLPGQYVLEYTSPGLTPETTTQIDMSAPAATQLAFVQQPTGGSVNAALTPPVVVEVRTAANALATGFNGPVTIALGANPGSATLGGTLTVNAVNGVATFADLSVNAAATGYTLTASASGLTGATSAAFDIVLAAVTNAWINAAGGTWSTAANWSQGRAPIPSDTVAIDLAGTYTVTLDQNFTGSLILLGGASGTQTLSATSRTLSTGLGLRIGPNGVYRHQGGTIGGTGTVQVRGRLVAVASGFVTPPLVIDTVGTLRVESSALAGATQYTASTSLHNAGLIEMESFNTGYNVVLSVTNAPLVNESTGIIRPLPGTAGGRTIAASLDNSGTLDLTSYGLGLSFTNAQHVNRAPISVSGGNLGVNSSGAVPRFTNLSTITVDSGRVFSMTNGTLDLTGGAVVGQDGTLQLSNVALDAVAANLQTRVNFGTTPTTLVSPLTVLPGDSLRIIGGVVGGQTLRVEGRLVALASVNINTPFEVPLGGAVDVRSSNVGGSVQVTVANGFTNRGTIDLVSFNSSWNAVFGVSAGTLINDTTGVIRSRLGSGGSRAIAAELENRGTLDIRHTLSLTGGSAQHVNLSTIALDSANLVVTQSGTAPSFTNLGQILIGNGRAMTVTNGALDLDDGLLTGPGGTLSTSNVTLAMTPATVKTVHQFGTLTTLTAPYTVPAGDSLRVRSGTLAGPGLSVEGLLVLGGTANLNLPFAVAAGGHLLLRATNDFGGFTATVANGFTNAGVIELTTLNTGYTVILEVTSGTLTNAATGVLRSSVGASGSRILRAALDNSGAFDLLHPLTIERASSVHVNRAPITLGANLTVAQTGTSPSFTNLSTITLPTGRTLTVTGGALDLSGGTVQGDSATLSTNNVTLTMTPASARTRFNFGTVTTLSGPYTVPALDSLRILGGTLAGPGLTVAGRVISQGNSTLQLPVTTETTGVIEARSTTFAGGHTLTVTNGFTNTGTIELVSYNTGYTTTFAVTNGTLTNAATGVIRTLAGAGGSRVLAAALLNEGSLDLGQGLELSKSGAAHVNRGTIPLSTANFTVTQTGTTPSFTNEGSITLAAGRTMSVSGGSLVLGGGTLVGHDGTLTLSGVTLDMTPASARTRFNFGVGSAFAAPYTIPALDSLRVLGGTVGGPGLTVAGRFVALGSTTIAAPVTTETSGVLEARSSIVAGGMTLTVTDGFTNTGTIELVSYNTGYTTSFNVTNGTLVNAAGGTIRTLAGAGGQRNLGAQLDNSGTLDLQHPLTLTRGSSAHVHRSSAVLTSDLTVSQSGTSPSFTNLGSLVLPAGRELTVTGGALDLSGGTLVGDTATLTLSNVSLTMTPASARTRFRFSGSTAFTAPYTIPAGDSMRVLSGTVAGPSLTVAGRFVSLGDLTIAAPITTDPLGTIEARSSSLAGGHTLTVANGFTNLGTIELVSLNTSYTTIFAVTNGTLVNAAGGVIRTLVGAGGARTLAAQLDNSGTLDILQPLTIAKASAAHVHRSALALSAANLTVTQTGTAPSFTNLGSITLGTGRTLSVTGGSLNLADGTLTGMDATLSMQNVSLSMTPASARTRFDFNTGTSFAGAYVVPPGDSLLVLGGTIGGPELTLFGRMVTLGTTTVAAPFAIAGGGELVVRSSALFGGQTTTISSSFTNAGTIDLVSENSSYTTILAMPSGTLVNASTGTIRALPGGGGGARQLNAQLDNQGTLLVNNPLTINRSGAAHVNSGSIAIQGANLTLTQGGTSPSFTNTGSITLAAGRTWTVTNGTLDLGGGALLGDSATLSTNNVTLAMTPASARTRFDFGTSTTLASAYSVPDGDSLRIVGGTLNGPSLTVAGRVVALGNMTLGLPVVTETTGILESRSNSAVGGVTFTVANGFTNNGLIDIVSTGSSFTSIFAVTSGVLVNSPSGVIRSSVGSAGSRFLRAALDNSGTLDLLHPLTMDRTNVAHVNRSSIALSTQDLNVSMGASGSFTNLGSVTLATGRTLSLAGGSVDLTGGTITGIQGTLQLGSGTATALTMTAPAQARARINFGATGTQLGSTLTIPAGDSLLVTGGSLSGTGSLDVAGVLHVRGSTTIAPSMVIDSLGTLRVVANNTAGSVTVTTPNGWTNTGTIELTSEGGSSWTSAVAVTNGSLVNASGATIRSAVGTGGGRTLTAQLQNAGDVDVFQSLTINRGSSVHVNSGSIAVDAAALLTVSQSGTTPSFANTGLITLAGTGNKLSVSGGQFVNTTGSLTGTGSLSFGGTVTADLAMPALDVPVNFGTGSTLANALTIPAGDTLVVTGGTLAGPGLTVNGALQVTSAATVSAPITTGAGSLIDVRANALTAPQSFTVNGILRMTSPSAGFNPTLTMTGQTLTIAAGASLETPFGAGTTRILNVGTIDNFGSVFISAPVQMNTTVFQQRSLLMVDASRTLTVGTLNLYSGSTTTVNGAITATTCSNLGGTIVGSLVCP